MPVPQRILTTSNIDQHVGQIARQLHKSLDDAETRQLAVKIVSHKVKWRSERTGGPELPMVEAWGEWFYWGDPSAQPCPPRVDLCEIELIWNFVVSNCRYVYDITNVDVFTTAEQTLKAGGGDCDDSTVLFGALLMAIGFSVRARVISTKESPNEWVHIYPMVGIPKDNPTQWMPLDCTVTAALPGWQYESVAKIRDYEM